MSVYAVVDAFGAEVVRWTGEAAAVSPLVTADVTGARQYVELWADGELVQRSDIGNRDPASMRYVVA